jgi:hypothetical protein
MHGHPLAFVDVDPPNIDLSDLDRLVQFRLGERRLDRLDRPARRG